MKELIKKISDFLHITDEDGRMNLTDVAFIVIMIKIMYSPTLDFPAVVTLATVCINKIHKRSQINLSDDSEQVKDMAQQISNLKDQVTPIIDKLKGSV